MSVQDAVRHPDLWTKEATGFAAAQAAAVNKAKGSKLPAPDLAEEAGKTPFQEWSDDGIHGDYQSLARLVPQQARPLRFFPTCLRNLAISSWSPPPQHLKVRGQLLYLQVGTLEGETIFITASTHGFYVNRSTSSKFDPLPRPNGEDYHSNSLFDLLCGYSAQFLSNFAKIFNDPLSVRDFFAVVPLSNCVPAAPWLARSHNHTADALRPQTAFLLTGTTSLDSLEGTRDWNEEIQSARELPRSSLPERHIRERALARLYSEFSKSAANAVPKVAAGEVQALNPMDKLEAQMFCVNNLFISRGVDGVDIYPYLGGDEAAHVAVSKDVQGIRVLNSLDVEGLCLLGTVVVDWQGERWVAQSIIPGLFRKRDEEDVEAAKEDEEKAEAEAELKSAVDSAKKIDGKADPLEDTQVVYGGVEGPEVIRTNASFHKVFEQVAKSLHLSKHPVKDAKSESHDLWLSVDSKGLRGADGRKYALDVARLAPVDVEFAEKDLEGAILEGDGSSSDRYPHEMILLRPELLEIYWDSQFRSWAREQLSKKQKEKDDELEKKAALENGTEKKAIENGDVPAQSSEAPADKEQATEPTIDSSAFDLSFNPDAFVKFKPPTEDPSSAAPTITDESDPSVAAVRAASKYLRDSAIPRLVTDVAFGAVSPVDGQSLSRQMHVRGINMRYLGTLAHLAYPSQHGRLDQEVLKRCGPGHNVSLRILRDVALQEMVLRGAKRILASLLKASAAADITACVSHFLNCLLGTARESSPAAEWTPSPFEDSSFTPAWVQLTPDALAQRIQGEVRKRFRFELPADFLKTQIRKPQLLRELCMRSGIQLRLRDYSFEALPTTNGTHVNGPAQATTSDAETSANASANDSSVAAKKKKKSTGAKKTAKESEKKAQTTTFTADDVLNMVPVIKDSASTSKVAEDAFETGRITIMSRGDRELGVDLLLEGLSFHETIYGMAHPETARCYALFAAVVHQFSGIINAETAAKIREEQEKQGTEDVQVELPAYTEHLSGATALRYQRQAVTISERTLGLDHTETLAQWASLAILERAEGNFEAALRCQARVLELQDIIIGQVHPERISALSNLATTLQNARNFEVSLKVFQSAHQLALDLFGPDNLHTANQAFELCQAQSLVGDLRTALDTLKESVRIFESEYGKDHPSTKEAASFLSRLAAAAVRVAKSEQSQKAREARSGNLLKGAAAAINASRGSGVGAVGSGAAGQVGSASDAAAAAAAAASAASGGAAKKVTAGGSAKGPDPELSVDELVKYISGGGAAKSAKGKKSAASRTKTASGGGRKGL
jgi:protein TIF31